MTTPTPPNTPFPPYPAVDPLAFARLQFEVEYLKGTLTELRDDMKIIKNDWTAAKGGTRVFMAVAAIVGSFVTLGINFLIKKM